MKHKKFLIGWILVVAVLAVASILVSSPASQETIQEAMRDAVLHETGRVSLFGLKNVNPGLISGMVVTAFLLIVAALIRIFAIPKFRYVPGKFQMLLEQVVGMFDNLAKSNSPHRNGFLGAYIFAAGVYIFVGTLFELFGVQAVSISGGIAGNGFKGVGSPLKEFSLPISMSFRLFGALLSGLLVTELIYYYIQLSFVLPVLVAVLFTLLHALIQSYVLTMLTALFYGEVSEPSPKKVKAKKKHA